MRKLVILILIFIVFIPSLHAQTPEERLTELNIQLPEVKEPIANFVKWRKVGNLVIFSGVGSSAKGKLGKDLTVEEGYAAARETGITILATVKAAIGDLSKIRQLVKVHGMVNSTPEFNQHPQVMNGFSDLMVEVFGEKGKHARAAVGHISLPFDIAVEIEVIVELEE